MFNVESAQVAASAPAGTAQSPAAWPLSDRGMNLVAAVALAAAIGILYYRVADAPFMFDDDISIKYNESLRQLWPLWGDEAHLGPLNPAPQLPTSGRPLVNLSFALNYAWGTLDPTGYRVVNLVIHYLSAMLVMLIVRRTLRLPYFEGQFSAVAAPLALVAALFWAVHPLQTEAVAYVTQRTELMVVFFYLSTFYCAQRYWENSPLPISPKKVRPNRHTAASRVVPNPGKSRAAWLVLAIGACAAGMACKEIMITAPAVVLLYEWTFLTEPPRRIARDSWPLYAGLTATWLLLLYLNVGGPRSGSTGFSADFSPWTWWSTQAQVFWMYLKLAVWPWPLVIHYEFPYLDTWQAAWPWVLPTVLLLVATVVLLWRRSPIGFVVASVMIILSPTSIVPIPTEMAAERRMYLPLSVLVALAIAGGYWLTRKLIDRRAANHVANDTLSFTVVGVVALLLALIGSLVSARRLNAYAAVTPLWQDALIHQPDNYTVNCNLAISLLLENRNEEALEISRRTAKAWPNKWKAYIVQGDALSRLGKTEEAIESLEKAVELRPEWINARIGLGVLLSNAGRFADAITQFRAASQMNPYDSRPPHLLAVALSKAGQLTEAVPQFEKALSVDAERADVHSDFGSALVKLGRLDDAREQFQRAVELDQNLSDAQYNLARVQDETGNLQDAIKHYEVVMRIRPNDFQLYSKLTDAYVRAGQPDKAIAVAEKAIELARSAGQTEAAEQVQNWLRDFRAQQATSVPTPASTRSPAPQALPNQNSSSN